MYASKSTRAARAGFAARSMRAGARWLGGRILDGARWPHYLFRDSPARGGRLLSTLWCGLKGPVCTAVEGAQVVSQAGWRPLPGWAARKLLRAGGWGATLVFRLFDLLGGPEIAELIIRAITVTEPLTKREITIASALFGPKTLRYADVRAAHGGLLPLAFALNGGRAFVTFHTINFPSRGHHARSNVPILMHELTHVRQYEHVGSLYIGEALHAQATTGYGYGGPQGLKQALSAGKHYSHFNREQQAQILQDYVTLCERRHDVSQYDPFLDELKAGHL